jgi:hypothetical protein
MVKAFTARLRRRSRFHDATSELQIADNPSSGTLLAPPGPSIGDARFTGFSDSAMTEGYKSTF